MKFELGFYVERFTHAEEERGLAKWWFIPLDEHDKTAQDAINTVTEVADEATWTAELALNPADARVDGDLVTDGPSATYLYPGPRDLRHKALWDLIDQLVPDQSDLPDDWAFASRDPAEEV